MAGGQLHVHPLALKFCVVKGPDDLSPLRVDEGTIFHNITFDGWTILLKLGPRLLVGTNGADVAHM